MFKQSIEKNYSSDLDERLAGKCRVAFFTCSDLKKEDTLYVMAGLGLLDLTTDNSFKANNVTRHLVEHPTKIQGILHL